MNMHSSKRPRLSGSFSSDPDSSEAPFTSASSYPSSNDAPIASAGGLINFSSPATSHTGNSATVRLSLVIPRSENLDQRTVNRRRSAARNWESKLQRPYPRGKEVADAYPLKLMRHYPAGDAIPHSNFVKPRIDRSARVDRLLRQFPISMSPPLGSATQNQGSVYNANDHSAYQTNRLITKSEQAQCLAWRCFSSTEQDRIDRGREAMMESGLLEVDLIKEMRGLENGLPEWKKQHTSRYSRR